MGILAAFAVPHPPLLIPGVGNDREYQVEKTERAFEEVAARSAELNPETLVVFSPHATMYADYFHISPGAGAYGDFAQFGAPQAAYSVEYDQEFVAALSALLDNKGIAGGTEGEREPALDHGTMVPLHFFQKAAEEAARAGKNDSSEKSACRNKDERDMPQKKAPVEGTCKSFKVVRIGLSGLSRELHREFGAAVAEAAEMLGRNTIIIASGDLSHKLLASGPYGYTPEGPEFDAELCAALAKGSVEDMLSIDEDVSEAAAECGLRSFIMMGGALEACKQSGHTISAELLSYEGPFGVGYAVASFMVDAGAASGVTPEDESVQSPATESDKEAVSGTSTTETGGAGDVSTQESLPVALAREALKSYFELGCRRPSLETPAIQALFRRYQETPEQNALYDELADAHAGAFVSLHKNGDLRGCIGTISATKDSVLAEILYNAVSAAREDPRFPPVEQSELQDLDIKVDVLGVAEPVTDRSTLDAERYGVIVSLGYRRGLLLPALEGVDTPEEQIDIALSKARIGTKEPYELERFEVIRYS